MHCILGEYLLIIAFKFIVECLSLSHWAVFSIQNFVKMRYKIVGCHPLHRLCLENFENMANKAKVLNYVNLIQEACSCKLWYISMITKFLLLSYMSLLSLKSFWRCWPMMQKSNIKKLKLKLVHFSHINK
jgi:hypothetical protein